MAEDYPNSIKNKNYKPTNSKTQWPTNRKHVLTTSRHIVITFLKTSCMKKRQIMYKKREIRMSEILMKNNESQKLIENILK